jgi:hypothetical protein
MIVATKTIWAAAAAAGWINGNVIPSVIATNFLTSLNDNPSTITT